ncbi:MAG: hypothetical protein ACFFFH_07340 [Candidatus Thorarchaeota archaeon]
MKTRNYQENYYQQLAEFGRSRPWLPLVGIIYFSVAAIILTQYPSLFIPELNISTVQFVLSLIALLILSAIGLYLLSNQYRTVWGVSFLLFAFSFLGLCLRIFGFPLTNINNPIFFHIWLLPLVLFTSGVWIGTSSLFIRNSKVNYLPAILIFFVGEIWFLIGLFILKDVPLTIFGLMYGLFIPVALFFIYSWSHLAKNSIFVSPWLLALGFLLMTVMLFLWNPWMSRDLSQFHSMFFSLFNISLGVILGGFFTLSRDLASTTD